MNLSEKKKINKETDDRYFVCGIRFDAATLKPFDARFESLADIDFHINTLH